MNTNYKRVPARFERETGFEVRLGPPAPFRARQEAELERLKARLLAEQLAACWVPQLGDRLGQAANDAAALAWVSAYPLLVFPVLFEEKAAAALLQAERQERIRLSSRELLAV